MEHVDAKGTLSSFITQNKANRWWLVLAIGVTITGWVLFKLAYPYPDFFSDSYSYIYAASANLDINIWPIGYSKFLATFHSITHSDIALVSFQYFSLVAAATYFYFVVLYLFDLDKTLAVVLFLFLFCNPLFLYISNYVSTDSLFCALTLVWFTELVRVVADPRRPRIIIQTICVFIAFTFRYAALYYPLITALAYIASSQRPRTKWLGVTLVVPMLFAFWVYSREAGRELTGRPLSSIIGGWQLANNALYMRGHISVDSNSLPDSASRAIDRLSQEFFTKAGPDFQHSLDQNMGNYFIQRWHAPLKVYMVVKYRSASETAWAKVSYPFGVYGTHLIKNYPVPFLKYFLVLNTGNYFLPSLEKLSIYNMGQDSVGPAVQEWFDYSSARIHVASFRFQAYLLILFAYLILAVNCLFVIGFTWFWFSGKFKRYPSSLRLIFILVSGMWFLNFLFSVSASIVVMRYEMFPFLMSFCFVIIFYSELFRKGLPYDPERCLSANPYGSPHEA